MGWSESDSRHFTARHESADAHHAADLLADLEGFRAELGEHFDLLPAAIAVVIHPHALGLSAAQPWLPLARRAAAPASRRYMAGWFSREEIHVLSPKALEDRASGVEGSREALLLSPLHEYAHLVIGANQDRLPPPFSARAFRDYLRWAWLCEGAATHFAGQTRYLRGAIARRLHAGPAPAFPPSARDAPLLACTVFTLLERRSGAAACAALARTHSTTARRALEEAFEEPLPAIEREWRDLLVRFGPSPRADIYDLEERRRERRGAG